MTATKTSTLAELKALADSTPKYFPNFAFLIASKTYTTAEVMTIVNTVLASATKVEATRSAAKDALQADDLVQAQYGPFIKELRQFIALAYSNANATLADFDIPPPKPRAELSVAEKAAANAKKVATREARGTKGKKQKEGITGNVSGVSITPITTGAAAAAPATAPAAAAPSAPTVTPVVAGTAAGTSHT